MARIYVITGMPGAGKEEFVNVSLRRGYRVVRMGDVVRQEAAAHGLALTDKEVGGFATDERNKYGPDIWAARCIPLIKDYNTVIDGSRSVQEIELFRKELGDNVRLVAIEASPSLRYMRLKERNRFDAPRNEDEFRQRDERELGWGLRELIAKADTVIINEGTLEEFYQKVSEELESSW